MNSVSEAELMRVKEAFLKWCVDARGGHFHNSCDEMSGHQPKELAELAFTSFATYMANKPLQLLKRDRTLSYVEEVIKSYRVLQDYFHGTRLPPVLANEITKQLLTKFDMFKKIQKYVGKDYFQQILLPLVEIFMHPDITSIELGPGYWYESSCHYLYCKPILTKILMKVGSLHNLKTLSLGPGIDMHSHVKLLLPAHLKELTLCGSLCFRNHNLESIVECCRELKSFKVLKIDYEDVDVSPILKLNHLETLHLLGDCCFGLDKDCLALVNGISNDATSDVLPASTLKSFGIDLTEENTLHLIVNKLPHLTEIVLHLPCEIDLSCLTQLENLRSLTLEAGGRASNDYKKILPVLGKNLVSLDLRSYKSLDLEFIGETCSKLRCLHVDAATSPRPSLKSFPNFETVECLKVKMKRDFDNIDFIIAQCLNIKVLIIVCHSEHTVIESVLKSISLANLEEIHWYPEVRIENTCLQELCLKCPKLRLVHGLGSNTFISGRVVFDFHGCRLSVCESHGYSPDFLYVTPDDYVYDCYPSSPSTSDSE